MENECRQIVVMGAGLAGLAAAVSAREKGAQVLVLESRKRVGGISVTGMGLFAVESHLQKELNLDSVFSKDDAFHYIMDRTQWKLDGKVARAYVDKSADTIQWLEDMGVRFELMSKVTFPGEMHQTGHLVNSEKSGIGANATADLIDKLCQRALDLGVEVRTGAAVVDIEKTSAGYKVTYKNAAEECFDIQAEAVVITAGGYMHDAEMMAHTDNGFTLNGNVGMVNNIPLTGDGIRLAWKLGAVPDKMSLMLTSYCDGEYFPRSAQTQPLWDLMMFSFPYLWVNKQGERFVDEGAMNGCYLANAIARQKDGAYFMILDQATKEKIQKEGPDIWGYLSDNIKLDLDEMFDAVIAAGADNYYRADTMEELAEQMGVPYGALKENVDAYNAGCHKGYDPLFDKKRKFLRPVETPKFYGIRRKNASYGSVGGIRIDSLARAIGKDSEPVLGLYAAGDCANSMVANDLGIMYSLWGSCLGFAANFGRIAGEAAADYVQCRRKEETKDE